MYNDLSIKHMIALICSVLSMMALILVGVILLSLHTPSDIVREAIVKSFITAGFLIVACIVLYPLKNLTLYMLVNILYRKNSIVTNAFLQKRISNKVFDIRLKRKDDEQSRSGTKSKYYKRLIAVRKNFQ